MQAYRTNEEISKDFKRIKDASLKAKSIEELCKMIGISYMQFRYTMDKHPKVLVKIKKQIEDNRKAYFASIKNNIEANNLNQDVTLTHEEKETIKNAILIDASISGVDGIINYIKNIMKTDKKIIITSITIDELEKLQKSDTNSSPDARTILTLAAENPKNFDCILIDNSCETSDDSIIKYCANNKENLCLLTADKAMALKARMYNIEVKYLKHEHSIKGLSVESNNSNPVMNSNNNKKNVSKNKICTLFATKMIGNDLVIPNFHDDKKSISVFSGEREYTSGPRVLKIGDDVYLATKKEGYVTFSHYKIISLNPDNNCELIYFRRIYNLNTFNLAKHSYNSFIKDFRLRHEL